MTSRPRSIAQLVLTLILIFSVGSLLRASWTTDACAASAIDPAQTHHGQTPLETAAAQLRPWSPPGNGVNAEAPPLLPASVWTDSSVGDDGAWRVFAPAGFVADGDGFALLAAAGILGGEVVVAGNFVTVDRVEAPGMAAWNGSGWRSNVTEPPPFYSLPYCLVEYNGRLVAGGSVATSASPTTSCVQEWDGSAWHPLGFVGGDSILAAVCALKVIGNDLIAAGVFNLADGQQAHSIARWDGTRWNPIGRASLFGEYDVLWDIEEYRDQLYACGRFALEDSVRTGNIMCWDGTRWSVVGGGTDGDAIDMLVHDGSLWIAGRFEHAADLATGPLVKWNGSSWEVVPAQISRYAGLTLYAMAHDGDDLFVAGNMDSVAGEASPGLVWFDGVRWSRFDRADPALDPHSEVHRLVQYNGRLLALGDLRVSGEPWPALQWDGSRWRRLGSEEFELADCARALVPTSRSIVAAAPFRMEESVRTEPRVASWDGHRWTALGGPIDGTISALAEHDGKIYAGGFFSGIGAVQAANIAMWDGTNWHPLRGGANAGVSALEVFQGQAIAAGAFTAVDGQPASAIAAWDGDAWHGVGDGVQGGGVDDLTLYDGDLIACGRFSFAGHSPAMGIARWDGVAWRPMEPELSPLPAYVSQVTAWQGKLVIDANTFTDDRYLAVGDGAQWKLIPTPDHYFTSAIGAYRDWLVVGGTFSSQGTWEPSYALLWNGNEWLRMGSGPRSTPSSRHMPEIAAMATWQGSLYLGGRMLYAGSQRTQGLAIWNGTPYAVAPELDVLQIGPNPARSALTMAWTQSGPGDVRFTVFDVRGRRVAQILPGFRSGGRQSLNWDLLGSSGNRVPVGIYVVQLVTERGRSARKVTVVR